MAINPIEAPIALDLTLRESAGGAVRSRRNTVPAPAGAPPSEPDEVAPPRDELQQPQPAAAALNMNLKFSTDEETGKTIVALIDPASGKVLRQVPSDEALKVAEQIGRFQGMFVDLKV
jgi:flagellar protein FlaG